MVSTTSQEHDTHHTGGTHGEQSDELSASPMMVHLMKALEAGKDIGHYGRLVFVMVARFFLNEDKMVELLTKEPDVSEEEARALIAEVKGHGYNPPRRERILQWQKEQDFPICPNPEDPGSCNVYSDLRFPDKIYDNIEDFWEEKAEAQQAH